MTTQNFELLKKSAVTQIAQDLANQTQAQLNQWDNDKSFTEIGDFTAGFTITARQQIALFNGEWYRWDGALPKVVAPGSTPIGTGGIAQGAWLSVGDAALRNALADPNSTVPVGGVEAGAINKHLDGLKDLTTSHLKGQTIRALAPGFPDASGGAFYWSPSVNKALHNGGTIFAPEAIIAWDGTKADIATLLNWTGVGSGCFVRLTLTDIIKPSMFGATFDGTDDAPSINKCLEVRSGKVTDCDSGVTYRCDSTILRRGHGNELRGNGCTFDSYATNYGMDSVLVGNSYPVNTKQDNFSIIARGANAFAYRVRTSYSDYSRIGIALTTDNVNGRGLALIGDENGTGPYYNVFKNIDVQSNSAGLDHIGVSFIASSIASGYRSPNANTFIGGRVGQCLKNYIIKGNGNVFYNPTSEGVEFSGSTGFLFEADTPVNCQQNMIVGGYSEGVDNHVVFNADASFNTVFMPFMTGGVTPLFVDQNGNNTVITDFQAWNVNQGLKFQNTNLSTDPKTLDYYEEGTWTPVPTNITVNSGTPVWTGTYTRIGNTVKCHVKMAGGNVTVNAGTSYVTLPFTASLVDWGVFANESLTIAGGQVGSYGNLLYFTDAITASVLSASVTITV